ncbi:ABC transporter ATP-binding protein [Streptomyces sp. NPDC088725]|uniref:ABC transporter ATP-binding protein n=1 Tax=Streptomyces sp. NPDC088725 TaxID=3365873 RepID=UPI003810D7D6
MAPDNPEEHATDRPVRRLAGLMRPHRLSVILALAAGVVGSFLNGFGPLLLGRVTDLIADGVLGKGGPAPGIDFGSLGRLLLILLVLYLAASAFMLIQNWRVASVVRLIIHDLRHRTQEKLARLPLRHFDRQPAGETLSRATDDVDNLQQTLQQTLTDLISSILSLVVMLTLMLSISPSLAGVMLLSVPVSGLLSAWIAKRAQPRYAAQWDASGKLTGHVEEMYAGHALVKAFDRRAEAEQRFDERNEAVYRAGAGAQFSSGAIEPVMMFVANLGYVAVAVFGAWKIVDGALTLGELQAFILYARGFSQPIVEIASVAGRLQSGVASAKRVFTLLDTPEQDPEPRRPLTLERAEGRVEFQDVSFRYSPDVPLIEGMSLSVEPGSTVAIVGQSGAGKTTVANLLMRFYEIDSGRILLDGTDTAGMNRDDLRSRFGLVLQDTWLFNGTIAENIAYGVPGASREEVVEAARATCADRFIRTLPQGYDTVLDDESGSVSAGEKQLITVARAFLARPSVLILDEATSSVDTRTELLIQRAMNTLRGDRTSFVIAHRLSTIRDADLIVVMDSGRIIEQGTHDQLIAADGAYARLYAARVNAPSADVAVG